MVRNLGCDPVIIRMCMLLILDGCDVDLRQISPGAKKEHERDSGIETAGQIRRYIIGLLCDAPEDPGPAAVPAVPGLNSVQ